MNKKSQVSSDDDRRRQLAFVLSSLRDDLSELISALEAGVLPPDTVAAGVSAQLTWVLEELVKQDDAGSTL